MGVVLVVATCTAIAYACNRGSNESPPKVGDVAVPPLSDGDRALLREDPSITSFVATTAALPGDAAGCSAVVTQIGQDSIVARTTASRLEDAQLRDILVNHSAATWDYLRTCSEDGDTEDLTAELTFYQQVLERWLAA